MLSSDITSNGYLSWNTAVPFNSGNAFGGSSGRGRGPLYIRYTFFPKYLDKILVGESVGMGLRASQI